ncbi:hypothetical protein B0H34DRAFT_799346 [Crassisporium funariophilum]|nr:hypothetical protein B0H34DRAFT_799346 [Crassisporium funariophilum]
MSGFAKNLKSKLFGKSNKASHTASGKQPEPAFSIQPHPATTNDPADLQAPGGLKHNGAMDAFHARDPHVPSDTIRNNLPEPLTRKELHARQAELNN